jgi:hypothetical protein
MALVAVVLSTVAPTTAEANVWCWLFGCGGGDTSSTTAPQRGAPEIDPGSLASAIALAAGGVAMLRDRVRRRR